MPSRTDRPDYRFQNLTGRVSLDTSLYRHTAQEPFGRAMKESNRHDFFDYR